ncbi:hypothetical protein JTE90_008255, partial [Oedothorax gibbosus]
GNYTGKRLSAPTLDVKDDAVITFKEHESPVICCAFSPDDQYIISCDVEYTYVWQINPQNWFNRCKKQRPNPKTPFNFCCFNNNGDLFAAASYNTIQVWDFETEILKTTINYGDFNINRFCFSPDDAKVLSISDNFVTECDVKSGNDKLVISTGPKKDYVLCSICVNDSYIACGTTKGSVIVISRETKTVVKNLRGHNRDVVNVAFSKDGKRLFSASSKAYILHDASHLTNSPLVSFDGTMSAHMDKELVVAASNYFNCVENIWFAHSRRWGYDNIDAVGCIVENFIDSAPIEFIENRDGSPTFLSYKGATSHPDLLLAHPFVSNQIEHTLLPAPGGAGHKLLVAELNTGPVHSGGQRKKYAPFWNKELQSLKEHRDEARDRTESTGLMSDCIELRKRQACLRKAIREAKRGTFRGFVEGLDFRKVSLRLITSCLGSIIKGRKEMAH